MSKGVRLAGHVDLWKIEGYNPEYKDNLSIIIQGGDSDARERGRQGE
jgi:hypothetical protein